MRGGITQTVTGTFVRNSGNPAYTIYLVDSNNSLFTYELDERDSIETKFAVGTFLICQINTSDGQNLQTQGGVSLVENISTGTSIVSTVYKLYIVTGDFTITSSY